jgi:hypothetical protein
MCATMCEQQLLLAPNTGPIVWLVTWLIPSALPAHYLFHGRRLTSAIGPILQDENNC